MSKLLKSAVVALLIPVLTMSSCTSCNCNNNDENPFQGGSFNPPPGKIAFVSERDGDGDLYLLDPNTMDITRLTNFGKRIQYYTWIPALRKLAVRPGYLEGNRFDENPTYLVDLDTLEITDLGVENVTRPKWSPDGTKILFENPRGTLNIMNADGSNQQQLSSSTLINYSWSPDGSKILCSTTTAIHAMNSDGSGKHNLVLGETDFVSAAWSPDGTKILYVQSILKTGPTWVCESTSVYILEINNEKTSRVFYNDVEERNSPFYGAPKWHGNDAIAYGRHVHLYTLNLDTLEETVLAYTYDSSYNGFAISQYGTKVVYASATSYENYDIWMCDANGENRTRLTTHARIDKNPIWIPN